MSTLAPFPGFHPDEAAPRRLGLAETVIGTAIALQFTPGLLGHCLMPLQLALALAGIGYLTLRSGAGLHTISLQPVRYLVWVVLYIFVAHLLLEPESVSVGFTDLIVGGIGLLYVGTLLTSARPRDLLVALVLIHALLAASDLLLVAARFVGLDQALLLATFPVKTYVYPAQWHLPFSFVYDQPVAIGSLMMPRAIGFYREPGVYQAFALTACAAALLLRDLPWRRTLAAVIVLGSATSLSTAWLASFAAMTAWAMLARVDRRSAASVVGVAVLLLVLTGAVLAGALIPGLGFSDKLAGESGQDRLRAFAALGPALTASPWFGLGQGTLQSREAIDSVSGSFVVGIARLGLVGTLIFLVATAATLFGRHDRRSLVMLVPLGATLLTSQPLYYSVAAYFLLALPARQALTLPATPQHRHPPLAPPAAPEQLPEPVEPTANEDHLPLVIIDDDLDEECWDEAIIPLVVIDDELEVVGANP